MIPSSTVVASPPGGTDGGNKIKPPTPDAWLRYDTVAMAKTIEGLDMVLQKDKDFYYLYLDGELLMTSEQKGSEEALAELGCAGLEGMESPRVLIGGLGMGFTLKAALNLLGENSRITTAEFSETIIAWNQKGAPLAGPSGDPVEDPRSEVHYGDFCEYVHQADPASFDAILIDIDNEPHALSYSCNDHLYSEEGLREIHRALSPQGVMALWFVQAPAEFDQRLDAAGFRPVRHEVSDGDGGTHLIILSSPKPVDASAVSN